MGDVLFLQTHFLAESEDTFLKMGIGEVFFGDLCLKGLQLSVQKGIGSLTSGEFPC